MGTVTDWAGNTFSFTYGASGQGSPTNLSVSSGAVNEAWSIDAAGSVTGIDTTNESDGTLLDLSIGRNADETVANETPTVSSGTLAEDGYGYTNGQLTSGPTTGCAGSCADYSYDSLGSITTDSPSFASAAYDPAGELCWSSTASSSNDCGSPPDGATTYGFNDDGELTSVVPSSGDETTYGWDPSSAELVCVNTDGSTCSTEDPTSSTTVYTYNGDGLRSSSTVDDTTTDYLWDDSTGTPRLVADSTWDYVYGPNSSVPLEQISQTGDSPTADLLLTDANDSVRGLVQLSGGSH